MENLLADATRALIAAYRRSSSDSSLTALRFAVLALALHDEDYEIIESEVARWIEQRRNAAALRGDDPQDFTQSEALQCLIGDLSKRLLYY